MAQCECIICTQDENYEDAGQMYYLPGGQQSIYCAHDKCINEWFTDSQHQQLNGLTKATILTTRIPYSQGLMPFIRAMAAVELETKVETKSVLIPLESSDLAKLQATVNSSNFDIDNIEWNARSLAKNTTVIALVAQKFEYITLFVKNEKFINAFLSWILQQALDESKSRALPAAIYEFLNEHPDYLTRPINNKGRLFQQLLGSNNEKLKQTIFNILQTKPDTYNQDFVALYRSIHEEQRLPEKLPLNASVWKEYIAIYGHPIQQLISLSKDANKKDACNETIQALLAAGCPYATNGNELFFQALLDNCPEALQLLLDQYAKDMEARLQLSSSPDLEVGLYLLLLQGPVDDQYQSLWSVGDDACKTVVREFFKEKLALDITQSMHPYEVLVALSKADLLQIKLRKSRQMDIEMEEFLLDPAESANAFKKVVMSDLLELGFIDSSRQCVSVPAHISAQNNLMFQAIVYSYALKILKDSLGKRQVIGWQLQGLLVKTIISLLLWCPVALCLILSFIPSENDNSQGHSSQGPSQERGNIPSKDLRLIAVGVSPLMLVLTFLLWKRELRACWLGQNVEQLYEIQQRDNLVECFTVGWRNVPAIVLTKKEEETLELLAELPFNEVTETQLNAKIVDAYQRIVAKPVSAGGGTFALKSEFPSAAEIRKGFQL